MALERDYNLVVNLGLQNTDVLYGDILTEKQIEQLSEITQKVFTIANTYNRIEKLEGSKELISFTLYIYRQLNGKLISTKKYSFTPSVEEESSNFFKQGYEYLKTLVEFENATDV